MSNKEIFSRTFGFSVRRFFFSILSFIAAAAICLIGFLIGEKVLQKGLLGLGIGAIIGLIFLIIVLRYIAYSCKAAQIAMMTQGVVTGELPDDVIGEGKRVVKSRFKTVAVFFAVTGVIRGIFNQLGNAITKLGDRVGGDTGRGIGSAISAVISVIVAYLCDCCLGWVFYRSDIGSARATCEGAVLFFKHGKTFAKNMGRVFGLGLLSLLVIGGVFGGLFYFIGLQFQSVFADLALVIQEVAAESEGNVPQFLMTAEGLTIAAATIGGLIIWSIIHGSFLRPFVLTGVLRNYMEAGIADIPTEDSFRFLDSKSKKFRKLHESLA
jgi:hypothetical protein